MDCTSSLFCRGSYLPLRNWYRYVTPDTTYSSPFTSTVSPHCVFYTHPHSETGIRNLKSKLWKGWNLVKKTPTYVLLLKCQLPNQREKIFAEIGSAHKSISLQSLKLAWFEVSLNSLTVLFCLFLITAGLHNVSKTMLLPLCCQQNVQRCSNMFQRSLEPWMHSETIA